MPIPLQFRRLTNQVLNIYAVAPFLWRNFALFYVSLYAGQVAPDARQVARDVGQVSPNAGQVATHAGQIAPSVNTNFSHPLTMLLDFKAS